MIRRVVVTVALLSAACDGGPPAANLAPTRFDDHGATHVDAPVEILTVQTLSYGDEDLQQGVLRIPTGDGPFPVVVLIHGGFWRSAYRLDLMEPLAVDLVDRGFVAWNIEYRAVGDPGGGYPGTLTDIASAIDHMLSLADSDPRIDTSRVAVVGHSAGGHLSLWSAGHGTVEPKPPSLRPHIAVGLAAVIDLNAAATDRLGRGAVQDFLGGEPIDVPDRYAAAQPTPDPEVVRLIHGSADDIVPPTQSTSTPYDVTILDGADHFDVIDPSSQAWSVTIAHLEELRDRTSTT